MSRAPRQVASLIEEGGAHVVLLELKRPGGDEIELMQEVHAVCDTAVIFMSECGRDKIMVKAIETGVANYIIRTVLAGPSRRPISPPGLGRPVQ